MQILPLPGVLRGTRRAQRPRCEIRLRFHECELQSHLADWLELIRFKQGDGLLVQVGGGANQPSVELPLNF